ncbi:hypothetical protein [Ralstonia soli]|uniref:Uncharacterized protein n=1 Tax=Ralstonia soli TaxID=2953896 RepID=A0ABT1AHC7_9RALS|nr:hypothetical protein [Ralstonia soli]MCO5397502.1 hypothetical protein [Ralstonia soli]
MDDALTLLTCFTRATYWNESRPPSIKNSSAWGMRLKKHRVAWRNSETKKKGLFIARVMQRSGTNPSDSCKWMSALLFFSRRGAMLP